MRLPRIAPDSPVAGAGHRLLMTGALAGLAGRTDRPSRAIAAALGSTALGRLPREERAWADRIEAHRRGLPSEVASIPGRDSRDLSPSERMDEATSALRWMSVPPVLGRFMLRLVRELAPRSCLELGTGFGISTAYQAAALELNGRGAMLSLDVARMTEIAEPGLERLGLGDRIRLLPGLLEDTLAAACERSAPIDYALLDAEHTEAATTRHFDALLPHLSDGAVVVLDDVAQTEEMRRAWRTIADRERVSLALGLRRVGVVALSGPAEGAA